MNRQERIRAVVDCIMSKNYNDLIPHRELLEAMQEAQVSPVYRDAVNAAMKKCLGGGKMIESVHKFGYRVVNPDDYTGQSVKCVVSGAKKIDHGMKILQHAPVRDMTPAGVESYNRVMDRIRVLQASVSGAKVEIHMLDSGRRHPLAPDT